MHLRRRGDIESLRCLQIPVTSNRRQDGARKMAASKRPRPSYTEPPNQQHLSSVFSPGLGVDDPTDQGIPLKKGECPWPRRIVLCGIHFDQLQSFDQENSFKKTLAFSRRPANDDC